ncbi:hypothetical protein [Luteolibacter sp. AS25]|uniref:hypothetical protein n=1 Tax=Luteolibacter sp. AS25 TaxID=3135776 RepID=UPI00398B653B
MNRFSRALIRFKIHRANRWQQSKMGVDWYRAYINVKTDYEVERLTTAPVPAYSEITGDSFFAGGIPFEEGALDWDSTSERTLEQTQLAGSHTLLKTTFDDVRLKHSSEYRGPHGGRRFITKISLYSRPLQKEEADSVHSELAHKLIGHLGDPTFSKSYEAFYKTPAFTGRLWDMKCYFVVHSMWHGKGDQPHAFLAFQRSYHPSSERLPEFFKEWAEQGGDGDAEEAV